MVPDEHDPPVVEEREDHDCARVDAEIPFDDPSVATDECVPIDAETRTDVDGPRRTHRSVGSAASNVSAAGGANSVPSSMAASSTDPMRS